MASGPEEPGPGAPGSFPCPACDMVFPSRTLRDSHAHRFCIGHLTGGLPQGRREGPAPRPTVQSHQPEDHVETHKSALEQGEAGGDTLKRLADEVQRLRVALQAPAPPQKGAVGPRAHLEALHARRLAEIGARTRRLEKRREEIRQQLGEVAGGDAGPGVLGQVMLAIQAQETRTQQALDSLGERVDKLQASRTSQQGRRGMGPCWAPLPYLPAKESWLRRFGLCRRSTSRPEAETPGSWPRYGSCTWKLPCWRGGAGASKGRRPPARGHQTHSCRPWKPSTGTWRLRSWPCRPRGDPGEPGSVSARPSEPWEDPGGPSAGQALGTDVGQPGRTGGRRSGALPTLTGESSPLRSPVMEGCVLADNSPPVSSPFTSPSCHCPLPANLQTCLPPTGRPRTSLPMWAPPSPLRALWDTGPAETPGYRVGTVWQPCGHSSRLFSRMAGSFHSRTPPNMCHYFPCQFSGSERGAPYLGAVSIHISPIESFRAFFI